MKYLPTDVSTFSTMIKGNYLYIDKTHIVYKLFSGGSRYYLLSRPRQFGKSLLISLLKELFSGNKDLFKDLWIANSSYDWKYHPTIFLDFATIAHATSEELSTNLAWTLDSIAQDYSIDTSQAPSPEAKLTMLITHLAKKHGPNSVVVLIDEYDKPLLDHLDVIDQASKQRSVLRNFYDVLKGMDAHLRAMFITGVSKFSKTSLFSGINNLNDISLDKEAAQLLGYTEEELQTYFSSYVQEIAQEQNSTPEKIRSTMKSWYNGYRFSEDEIKVYNPFSILYYLKKRKFLNYWFESGTPSFLVKLLKHEFSFLENLHTSQFSRESLGTFNISNIPLLSLLFQTGYLTIADYDPLTDKFNLGYPNTEVEESLNKYLLATLTSTHALALATKITRLAEALKTNAMDDFCRALESLFASIPYTLHIDQERYFHSLFQFLGTLLGLEMQSEVLTNKGRIDLVISTKNYVYLMELKYNMQAQKALDQIETKKYFERYALDHRPIVLVGLAFKYDDKKLVLECKSKTITP